MEKEEFAVDGEVGLSVENRRLIVTVFTIALFLWSPVREAGMAFYIYLFMLPILLWLILRYFGSRWALGREGNNRLYRAIWGIVAGWMFFQAYLYATASYHAECDQWAGNGENRECVGDYITASGPDVSGAMITTIFGALAGWYAIARHKED